jgi:hypothetical protein
MTPKDLADLEAALPLMTPQEQEEAIALLEADRKARFVSEIPDDILRAVCAVSDALSLARGAEPAHIRPHPSDLYSIFDDEGRVRPYADWCHRNTGQALTHRERAGICPLSRWTHNREFDVDPMSDAVLALLPPEMAETVRQAKERGAW